MEHRSLCLRYDVLTFQVPMLVSICLTMNETMIDNITASWTQVIILLMFASLTFHTMFGLQLIKVGA